LAILAATRRATTRAHDLFAYDRRRHQGGLLVPVGALPGLPNDQCNRLAHALDRHPDAAVTSLIPALSCRSCRPNAPFAELVRLSRTSIADEMREAHRRRVLGE